MKRFSINSLLLISFLSVTGMCVCAQNKTMQIYKNGKVVNTIKVSRTDSIKFVDKSTETITVKGVSFEMIPVEGGTFQMGSSTDWPNEAPVHAVALSNFKIGKFEVTQQLWLAVMGSWPSNTPSPTYGLGNDYPAYYISWNDIVGTTAGGTANSYTVNGVTYYQNGFCCKLSQLVGGGLFFRLPTEAEWEYAARGGMQTNGYTYSGGNTLDDVAWYSSNSGSSKTHPVGTKKPNELGLYDMSGNVWEWCSDRYGSYSSGTQINPIGPTSGSTFLFRGGSWYSTSTGCRVSMRGSDFSPTYRCYEAGFRLVLH